MVTSRRMWIYSVVFEDPSLRWNFNLLQKFLWRVYTDPSLSDRLNLASECLYLNVSLFTLFDISRGMPKEIPYVLTVYLEGRNFNHNLLTKLTHVSLHFSFDENCYSRQNTSYVWWLSGIRLKHVIRVWALHGISFTRSSLSISKYASVFSI